MLIKKEREREKRRQERKREKGERKREEGERKREALSSLSICYRMNNDVRSAILRIFMKEKIFL